MSDYSDSDSSRHWGDDASSNMTVPLNPTFIPCDLHTHEAAEALVEFSHSSRRTPFGASWPPRYSPWLDGEYGDYDGDIQGYSQSDDEGEEEDDEEDQDYDSYGGGSDTYTVQEEEYEEQDTEEWEQDWSDDDELQDLVDHLHQQPVRPLLPQYILRDPFRHTERILVDLFILLLPAKHSAPRLGMKFLDKLVDKWYREVGAAGTQPGVAIAWTGFCAWKALGCDLTGDVSVENTRLMVWVALTLSGALTSADRVFEWSLGLYTSPWWALAFVLDLGGVGWMLWGIHSSFKGTYMAMVEIAEEKAARAENCGSQQGE